MDNEETKSQPFRLKVAKQFSSLQNFSDYIEVQENRKKEYDRKEIEGDKSFLAYLNYINNWNSPIQNSWQTLFNYSPSWGSTGNWTSPITNYPQTPSIPNYPWNMYM